MIFNLVHFGYFDPTFVYEAPVQYRMFYYRKLMKVKEEEKREVEKAQGKMESAPTNKIVRGPAINRRG